MLDYGAREGASLTGVGRGGGRVQFDTGGRRDELLIKWECKRGSEFITLVLQVSQDCLSLRAGVVDWPLDSLMTWN